MEPYRDGVNEEMETEIEQVVSGRERERLATSMKALVSPKALA